MKTLLENSCRNCGDVYKFEIDGHFESVDHSLFPRKEPTFRLGFWEQIVMNSSYKRKAYWFLCPRCGQENDISLHTGWRSERLKERMAAASSKERMVAASSKKKVKVRLKNHYW